jgi:hypothetical protein
LPRPGGQCNLLTNGRRKLIMANAVVHKQPVDTAAAAGMGALWSALMRLLGG